MKPSVQPLAFDAIRLVDEPWFPYVCTEAEGWRWQSAIGDHFNLWIVLGGQGLLWCGQKTYPLRPGSVFVFTPGQDIRANHSPGSPITRLAMHFVPVGWRPPEPVPGLPFLGGVLSVVSDVRPTIQRICGLDPTHELDTGQRADEAYGLLNYVTKHARSGETAHVSPAVMRCLDAMQADPARTFEAGELARLAGMSRSHLDRLFIEQIGQPPRRYLIGLRIARAQQLLSNTDFPIAQIAERLGYRDVYFFSRQFKQVTGQTPTGYRKKISG